MPKNRPDKDPPPLFFFPKVQIKAVFKIRIKYNEVCFTFKGNHLSFGKLVLELYIFFYILKKNNYRSQKNAWLVLGYMILLGFCLPMQEIKEAWVWSLGQEDPLEEEMATHSSILAWKTPWTEEPGGRQSLGLQRVRHDSDWAHSRTWAYKRIQFEGTASSTDIYTLPCVKQMASGKQL